MEVSFHRFVHCVRIISNILNSRKYALRKDERERAYKRYHDSAKGNQDRAGQKSDQGVLQHHQEKLLINDPEFKTAFRTHSTSFFD